jgi:hypothetical protein
MAASLDKETLAKHGFWFLVGGYVLLVLGCLAVLATSVSDSVRKEQDELKKAEDLVKGVKGDANQTVVDAYKKQDDLVDGKRNEVWGSSSARVGPGATFCSLTGNSPKSRRQRTICG